MYSTVWGAVVLQLFQTRVLTNVNRLLDEQHINDLRDNGQDVRVHLVSTRA